MYSFSMSLKSDIQRRLWSGVLLSKSQVLVGEELPPLLGLPQGTSLKGVLLPNYVLPLLSGLHIVLVRVASSELGRKSPTKNMVEIWTCWETPCSRAPVSWSQGSSAMASQGCPVRCHLHP